MDGKTCLRRVLAISGICTVCLVMVGCSTMKQPAVDTPIRETPTVQALLAHTPTRNPVSLPSNTELTHTPSLASRPTATATPTSIPTCGRSIVFYGRQQLTHSLALVDVCSQEPVFLTDDKGQDEWPRWSPDGTHIAFLSTRATNIWDDYRDLWLLNVTTHELSQLTFDNRIRPWSGAFVWSPQGDEILYSHSTEDWRGDIPQIVSLQDGNVRPLPGCLYGPFSWSSDGNKIALAMCLDMWENPPQGRERDMWFPGNLVVMRPDGGLIAGRNDLEGYRLPNCYDWPVG